MEGAAGLGLRAGVIAAALGVWYASQRLLGKRPAPPEAAPDLLHRGTAPLHARLLAHPRAANATLAASSALIDATGLALVGAALLGPTFRPFVAVLAVFALRQVCQALVVLPSPPGAIWRDPGVPTLFVTYGTGGDYFFSGHTAIAVLGALEASLAGPPWLAAAAGAVALVEVAVVIVLRAHWTVDVVAGAVAAAAGETLAFHVAPWLDARLALAG